MIILEDTRQQRLKHNLKRDYFKQQGIVTRKVTLDCGDYTLVNDRSVAIDTKKDIQELIGDIIFKKATLEKITEKVNKLFKDNGIDLNPQKIIRTIYDEDGGRYPEQEILEYCYQNDLPDEVERALQQLYVQRHGFFHRGLKRAEHGDVKLYILVENNDGVKDLRDLYRWQNPRLRYRKRTNEVIGTYKNGNPRYKTVQLYPNATRGVTLAKACQTMQLKYGVTFKFCTPQEAGPEIVRLLTEGE